MAEFIERAEIETGFAAVFASEVAPKLDTLEEERLDRNRRGWRYFGIGVAVGLVFGGFLALLIPDPVGRWIGSGFGLLFGLIGGFAARAHQGSQWSGAVAEAVMPAVCDFLGSLKYDRDAYAGFPVGRVRELGMGGHFNRTSVEDLMEGIYRDTRFAMAEVTLRHKSRKSGSSKSGSSSSTKEVFKGLMFRIALPQPTPTRILVARNYGTALNALAGFFSGSTGRGMPRVETGHEAFEKDFELHAAEPDRVPDYLPPAFLNNLVAIGAHESEKGAKGMRAAFDGEDFFLVLERRRPFMEMAKLSRPVHDVTETLHDVFDDLSVVRRIIDRLRGDPV
ncbi:hypothetical protein P279_03125 [Rhodobacteraceae bacterium PD-2]|nr:hypothetical protein P279_03125 [Rhodobacteraceae bacterium PD-2]